MLGGGADGVVLGGDAGGVVVGGGAGGGAVGGSSDKPSCRLVRFSIATQNDAFAQCKKNKTWHPPLLARVAMFLNDLLSL